MITNFPGKDYRLGNRLYSSSFANNFGNLREIHFGYILVGSHAAFFTGIDFSNIFAVCNVCVDNGSIHIDEIRWEEEICHRT